MVYQSNYMKQSSSIGSVGKYTYGYEGITIMNFGENSFKLNIGSFCSIASYVTVFLNANHRIDWVTTYPFGHIHNDKFNKFDGHGHPTCNGDVNLGNDVWIGQSVTIMSGVSIGDGSIIAANSVVTKNVAPYSIVGGNPSKLIKYRFTPEQIVELIKINWYSWDDDKINDNLQLLCCNDIDIFITKHSSHH